MNGLKFYIFMLFLFPALAFPQLWHNYGSVGYSEPASELSVNDVNIEYYRQMIISHFKKKGITYGSSLIKKDPFLAGERCGERYHSYRIRSIDYIKSKNMIHQFRVYCSGFDTCNKTAATDEYIVTVNKSDNGITYRKVER